MARKRNIKKETAKVNTVEEQPKVVEPTEEPVVVEHTEQPTDAELADKQPEVKQPEVEAVKEQPEKTKVEKSTEVKQPEVEAVKEQPEKTKVEKSTEVKQPEVEAVKEQPEKTKEEVLTGVTKEQADIAAMLDKQAIDGLLKKPGMDIKDKLKTIAEKAIPAYKQIAAKLLGYVEVMGVGIVDPNIGVGKQLDLVNTLKSAVETKDSGEFKTKLDIVNLAFIAHKDSALNIYKVYRFDDKWKWNKKDLTTLQHLTMVISTLASLADRKENMKKIDLDKALNKDIVNLSEDAINNIKSYYKA